MSTFAKLIIIFIFNLSFIYSQSNNENSNRTLIAIAAPSAKDAYYQKVYQHILNFDVHYAKKVLGKDNVVVIGDKKSMRFFYKKLPQDILLETKMRDIWIRDYSTVIPSNPIQFRYAAAAQGGKQSNADWVQKAFIKFSYKLNLKYKGTEWILDGGNVVDNDKDKAIVTDRFLKDNNLSMLKAKQLLKKLLNVDKVAIIASDDEEGLAHADGMAMFIENNVLVVNRYKKGTFRNLVLQELKQSFPGIKIIEIKTIFDNKIWDQRFSSAKGIYVNSAVTDRYIYLPVYGIKTDKTAIKLIKENTSKKVVVINASKIGQMGGSVRCLSWQVKGENAKKLIKAARK